METLKVRANNLYICLASFIEDCEKGNVVNEQWFLDWIDKINKLSVKY